MTNIPRGAIALALLGLAFACNRENDRPVAPAGALSDEQSPPSVPDPNPPGQSEVPASPGNPGPGSATTGSGPGTTGTASGGPGPTTISPGTVAPGSVNAP